MMKTFWEWLKDKQRKDEWQPIPLELPINYENYDPSMITPPTTSSKDDGSENANTSEDTTTVSFVL